MVWIVAILSILKKGIILRDLDISDSIFHKYTACFKQLSLQTLFTYIYFIITRLVHSSTDNITVFTNKSILIPCKLHYYFQFTVT